MLLLKTLRLFDFDNLSQVESDFNQTLRRRRRDVKVEILMQIPRFSEVLSLCYFVGILYFENILCPFEKCFYTYQRIQLLVILTSLRLFTFSGNLPPYGYSRPLRLLILARNSSPYAYSIPHVYQKLQSTRSITRVRK